MIKFMANQSFVKYLYKKGVLADKDKKNIKNTQEIYKTG